MEPVQNGALVEEVALGRVHVLATQRIVLTELARLKPDHAAARVGEREHEALREVVGASRRHQARRLQLVEREAALARLVREPLARRQPETELLGDLLAEPASGEVLANRRGPIPVPEEPLEVRGRLVEHGVEALAPPPRFLHPRRCLLDLDRHAKPLRKPLDCADEVEVLGLADERDDVPPFPQPKQ